MGFLTSVRRAVVVAVVASTATVAVGLNASLNNTIPLVTYDCNGTFNSFWLWR